VADLGGPGVPLTPTRLTTATEDEVEIDWAPGGAELVFTSLTETYSQIFRVPVSGGAPTYVGGSDGLASPAYSPDGKAIYAHRNVSTGGVVRLAGGIATDLSGAQGGFAPKVSPDGSTVVFAVAPVAGAAVPSLRSVPSAGGSATTLLVDFVADWSWSRDSQRLYVGLLHDTADPDVDSGWDTWSIDRTGGDLTRVTSADAYDELGATELVADATVPTLSLTAAAWQPARATVSFIRGDSGDRVGDLRTTCAVDGGAAVPCVSPWTTAALPSGPHSVSVTVIDPQGNSTSASAAFTVDATAPTVVAQAAPRILLSPTWVLNYSAADAGAGVASYDVRYRGSFAGPYQAPRTWTGTTARSQTLGVTPLRVYCWSVRARDKVGNVSAWSADRCSRTPLEDNAFVAVKWSKVTGPAYYNGRALKATAVGATLTTRNAITGKRVDLLVSRCPTCGAIDVYVAGKKIGRVSLRGPKKDKVLVSLTRASTTRGVIRIVKVGTGPAIVDGWLVHPT
jgi:hypothetical protein